MKKPTKRKTTKKTTNRNSIHQFRSTKSNPEDSLNEILLKQIVTNLVMVEHEMEKFTDKNPEDDDMKVFNYRVITLYNLIIRKYNVIL